MLRTDKELSWQVGSFGVIINILGDFLAVVFNFHIPVTVCVTKYQDVKCAH